MSVKACYYDGQSSLRRDVLISLEGQSIRVSGDGVDRVDSLAALRLSEPMGNAPRLITFGDGAFCETRDHEAFEQILQETGFQDHFIVRWQSNFYAITVASVLGLLFLVTGYFWGLPWVAEHAANALPVEMVQRLSDEALSNLDKSVFKPSELSPERQAAIVRSFEALQPIKPTLLPQKIVFRSSKVMRANAIALPSGLIVVTDALVQMAQDDAELMGVLAHELGHVQERHGLRLLFQSTLVGVVAAWFVGDVSTILAAVPAVLLEARYSRDFEREADEYSAKMMRHNGLSAKSLADILERMAAKEQEAGMESGYSGYLSSHPATKERLDVLRSRQ